jgi:hypothetical protein
MRRDEPSITTDDPDAVAAVMFATDATCTIYPGRELVEFSVPATPEVREALAAYATGELTGSLREFAKHRTTLIKYIQQVRKLGKAVTL